MLAPHCGFLHRSHPSHLVYIYPVSTLNLDDHSSAITSKTSPTYTMDSFNYSNRLVHQPYTESFGSPVLLCSSPDNQIIDHCYPEEYQPMFNTCQSPLFRSMQPILPTQHEHLSGQCTPTWPESYPYQPVFMDYKDPYNFGVVRSSPSLLPSIEQTVLSRPVSRAPSFRSDTSSSWMSCPRSNPSRSSSPNAGEMSKYGAPSEDGTWRCAFPGCTSKSVFRRGCDLRKHYRRHTKTLFCRHIGCRSASEGGFSSEKDRARHEAKHDPKIVCEWDGCSRVFSRVDNMVSSTAICFSTTSTNISCREIMFAAFTAASSSNERVLDCHITINDTIWST